MNAFTALFEDSSSDVAFGPYVLPGAWALGEGLDLAMPITPRSDSVKYELVMSGVWFNILDTVAVALDMVGWEWEYRRTPSTTCSPSLSSQNSSCDLDELDVAVLSGGEESEPETPPAARKAGGGGLRKQYYDKQD